MTIKDIARECGCAVGTVSRVLNNHPDVSEKTRARVMAVVERYGFVVNANAKQLKSQERKNLAILVQGTSSTLLNSLLVRGILVDGLLGEILLDRSLFLLEICV